MSAKKKPRMTGVVTMMSEELKAAIDQYRFEKRIWSRAKAIRALIESGLKKEGGMEDELGRHANDRDGNPRTP